MSIIPQQEKNQNKRDRITGDFQNRLENTFRQIGEVKKMLTEHHLILFMKLSLKVGTYFENTNWNGN